MAESRFLYRMQIATARLLWGARTKQKGENTEEIGEVERVKDFGVRSEERVTWDCKG